MKITTLIFAFGIASVGFSQVEAGTVKSNEASQVQSEQLTFNSQEEKDKEIERIETLIARREAQGISKDKLTNHYAELKRVQSARVLTINTTK